MCDRMRTFCAPFLLMAVLFCGRTAAIADDSNNVWHVSSAFGNVWVTVGGVRPTSLSHSRILKPGDSIRTGQNGRALLVHGDEYMLISPNSAIEIPRETKQGLLTTIIQRSGSIVLDVEKRNVKHFEVETPLLAALVKGTQFRVTVEKDRSYVDVLRGQVEVSDLRSGQYALVEPEQTAKVSAQHSGLSLSGSGTLGSIQQGTPRRSSADPAPVTKDQERRWASDSRQNEQPFDEASLHRDVKSIPASREKSDAKQNLRFSLSKNLIQGSPAKVSKEDQSARDSAAREQPVRVASLLSEGDSHNKGVSRNEGASSVASLHQSANSANDSSKPDDDTMRIVLIGGVAFIVSSVVSTLRRRKKQ